MTIRQVILLSTITGFLSACSSSKILVPEPLPMAQVTDSLEIRNLDTLVVSADPKQPVQSLEPSIYRATTTRTFDLLHTKLDLQFDWSRQEVIGKAFLTLTPYFYPASILTLDAKDFRIGEISMTTEETELKYTYDGREIQITLDKVYNHGEEVNITVTYTCTPASGEDGSPAITSDQGLFFINADGEDQNKPQQIWTQGETEFNSRWFPTIDKPNERCTQEMILTVEDRFVTLSNGVLTSSVSNSDGTRTDHWVMDMPHAPYLFMLAIGEFAVERETWNDKEVSYYVEPKYKDDAKDIFAHTPEMLTFFSELVNFEYPWQKYAQVVVRDYVSGAMENTTSVVFGEFVQKHRRELIDNHNDPIVAHEMFHHWFGDYVTCESWSNLTLNEGFANYAEYLWLEHKYGHDEAEHHRIQEIQGYLYQASQDMHPLIDFGYENKENMFDAHSYNKGGLVLHMLRHILGDKAFFTSLESYLKTHALSSVEVHDLRLAFEKTTGLDLNWFFNQWYLSSGHPVIDFKYSWKEENKTVTLNLEQQQDVLLPAFRIPTEIEIYYGNGTKERRQVVVEGRSQKIELQTELVPEFVVLDPDRISLAIINATYSSEQYRKIYDKSVGLTLRTEALAKIATDRTPENQALLLKALDDPFWAVRNAAITHYSWENNPDQQSNLLRLAAEDPHSMVRAEAIYLLGALNDEAAIEVVLSGINDHDAYPVVVASLLALNDLDTDLALEHATVLESETQSDLVAGVSTIYSSSGDTSKLAYFASHLLNVAGLPALDFYEALDDLLAISSPATKMNWSDKLSAVAIDKGISPYTKISAARSMIFLFKEAKESKSFTEQQINDLKQKIDLVIEKEENPQILSIYQSFMSS